jgi:hypothetical protein
LRNSAGSLAMFAAIRRASSSLSNFAAERRPGSFQLRGAMMSAAVHLFDLQLTMVCLN